MLLLIAAAAMSLFAMAVPRSHAASVQPEAESTPAATGLHVGALLDLTDGWSTLGKTSQEALDLAAAEINSQPASAGLPHVTVTVADTGLDPDTALARLQQFYADGIRVVIGPQSSSEVAAVREYAQEHGIIIISQGSTASSLSLPGDTVFRLAPDDRLETQAMAALLKADGITTIVPVWRADAGNQGLASSLRTAFEAAGGTVTNGVEYPADATDFGPVLDDVEAQVATAKGVDGAKVGVYLAAFGEAAPLFDEASTRPALGEVEWYGSDGIALSPALTSDPAAAAFAQKVTFPSPIFGLDRSTAGEALWQPIANQIKEATGIEPDAFGLSAYDALILAANTAKQADPTADAGAFATALMAEAAASSGITGPLTLNDAGDRAAGPFDFWAVCQSESGYTWILNATYSPAEDGPGTITRVNDCETTPPTCDTQAITLDGQWTLIAWPGPDSSVSDAVAGGTDTCRNDVSAQVSVVWSFDSVTKQWHGYFPGTANVPGANDLDTLTTGGGYMVGLVNPSAGPVEW
jgi:branched-chain amino acid transport system substrate-binding protein